MQKKMAKKQTWKDIKSSKKRFDRDQLIELIGDFYKLSKNNKDFLHARFSVGQDQRKPYKKRIKDSLSPDFVENEDFNFCRAQQAISEYSKAVGDLAGTADLMIYYVECGNKFTIDYGDIDESFYDAMLDMYERAIEKVFELPKKEQKIYRERLKKIMASSDGIGWGYHDGLSDYYYEAFQED